MNEPKFPLGFAATTSRVERLESDLSLSGLHRWKYGSLMDLRSTVIGAEEGGPAWSISEPVIVVKDSRRDDCCK